MKEAPQIQIYYVENQQRPETGKLHYEVVPVDETNVKHFNKAASVDFKFEVVGLPSGDFRISSSFVKVGEEVTLTAGSITINKNS
ncbi:hypothetical protein MGH68_17140 [Erysipelothrix sp. D19-032]